MEHSRVELEDALGAFVTAEASSRSIYGGWRFVSFIRKEATGH